LYRQKAANGAASPNNAYLHAKLPLLFLWLMREGAQGRFPVCDRSVKKGIIRPWRKNHSPHK